MSYKYDPTGRRVERVSEDLNDSTTKVSRWSYFKDDQWTEMNDQGQVLAVTLNGESIDDVLALTVKDQNQATPGIALEPIKDHLGSIYGWTERESRAVIHKQSYSAYGETEVTTSSPLLTQLGALRGYTGRELDEDTGIYYYRARYYDPSTGRFLTLDRLGFNAGDPNFYRYVFNNPIRYTDPSGNIRLVRPVTPVTSFLSIATGGPSCLNDGEKQELERINQERNLQNILNQYNTTLPPVNSSPSDVIVITDPNQPVIRQGP